MKGEKKRIGKSISIIILVIALFLNSVFASSDEERFCANWYRTVGPQITHCSGTTYTKSYCCPVDGYYDSDEGDIRYPDSRSDCENKYWLTDPATFDSLNVCKLGFCYKASDGSCENRKIAECFSGEDESYSVSGTTYTSSLGSKFTYEAGTTFTECTTRGCTNGQHIPCQNQKGVCVESYQICEDGILPGCDSSTFLSHSSDYETTENKCGDGLDNDCDGKVDSIDEDCAVCTEGVTEPCPRPGICSNLPRTCTNGVWGVCNYATINGYEASVETTCNDGLDNDCDGRCDLTSSSCTDGSTPGDDDCTSGCVSAWSCDGWPTCENPGSPQTRNCDDGCGGTREETRNCPECDPCNAPFGLFGMTTTCDEDMCYLEYTPTIVDAFFDCAEVVSCYDYKSEAACGDESGNMCLIEVCRWGPSEYSNLGRGVCFPETESLQDCSKCNENDYKYNLVFDKCDAARCSLFGDTCTYNVVSKQCRSNRPSEPPTVANPKVYDVIDGANDDEITDEDGANQGAVYGKDIRFDVDASAAPGFGIFYVKVEIECESGECGSFKAVETITGNSGNTFSITLNAGLNCAEQYSCRFKPGTYIVKFRASDGVFTTTSSVVRFKVNVPANIILNTKRVNVNNPTVSISLGKKESSCTIKYKPAGSGVYISPLPTFSLSTGSNPYVATIAISDSNPLNYANGQETDNEVIIRCDFIDNTNYEITDTITVDMKKPGITLTLSTPPAHIKSGDLYIVTEGDSNPRLKIHSDELLSGCRYKEATENEFNGFNSKTIAEKNVVYTLMTEISTNDYSGTYNYFSSGITDMDNTKRYYAVLCKDRVGYYGDIDVLSAKKILGYEPHDPPTIDAADTKIKEIEQDGTVNDITSRTNTNQGAEYGNDVKFETEAATTADGYEVTEFSVSLECVSGDCSGINLQRDLTKETDTEVWGGSVEANCNDEGFGCSLPVGLYKAIFVAADGDGLSSDAVEKQFRVKLTEKIRLVHDRFSKEDPLIEIILLESASSCSLTYPLSGTTNEKTISFSTPVLDTANNVYRASVTISNTEPIDYASNGIKENTITVSCDTWSDETFKIWVDKRTSVNIIEISLTMPPPHVKSGEDYIITAEGSPRIKVVVDEEVECRYENRDNHPTITVANFDSYGSLFTISDLVSGNYDYRTDGIPVINGNDYHFFIVCRDKEFPDKHLSEIKEIRASVNIAYVPHNAPGISNAKVFNEDEQRIDVAITNTPLKYAEYGTPIKFSVDASFDTGYDIKSSEDSLRFECISGDCIDKSYKINGKIRKEGSEYYVIIPKGDANCIEIYNCEFPIGDYSVKYKIKDNGNLFSQVEEKRFRVSFEDIQLVRKVFNTITPGLEIRLKEKADACTISYTPFNALGEQISDYPAQSFIIGNSVESDGRYKGMFTLDAGHTFKEGDNQVDITCSYLGSEKSITDIIRVDSTPPSLSLFVTSSYTVEDGVRVISTPNTQIKANVNEEADCVYSKTADSITNQFEAGYSGQFNYYTSSLTIGPDVEIYYIRCLDEVGNPSEVKNIKILYRMRSICGNNFKESQEQCEDSNLDDKQCDDFDDYDGGDLSCKGNCEFDYSECTGGTFECGDGAKNQENEDCDGDDLGIETCEKLGYAGGTLYCANDCEFDKSGCVAGSESYCGDNSVQQPNSIGMNELCDGSNNDGKQCNDFDGYNEGVLSCKGNCEFDYSECTGGTFECSDGIKNQEDEDCDGDDLGSETCETLGYVEGTLTCKPNCEFDKTQCGQSTTPTLTISLKVPNAGYSTTKPYHVEIETDLESDCKYMYSPTEPLNNFAYSSLTYSFTSTDNKVHSTPTDIDETINYIYVNCIDKGTQTENQITFKIGYDENAPTITDLFTDEPLFKIIEEVDTKLKKTVFVKTDKESICRYGKTNLFGNMQGRFTDETYEDYKTDQYKDIEDSEFVHGASVMFNVSCKGRNGLISEPREMTITVDLNTQLQIVATYPTGYIGKDSTKLKVRTNKYANCRFYKHTTEYGTSNNKKFNHESIEITNLADGENEFNVTCTKGNENVDGKIRFIVDTTPPARPSVTAESYCYKKNGRSCKIKATWSAEDTVSGIKKYKYYVTNGTRGSVLFEDQTDEEESEELDSDDLNLEKKFADGDEFTFLVKAQNNAWLWGENGSDKVRVDYSKIVKDTIAPRVKLIFKDGKINITCDDNADSVCAVLKYYTSTDGKCPKSETEYDNYVRPFSVSNSITTICWIAKDSSGNVNKNKKRIRDIKDDEKKKKDERRSDRDGDGMPNVWEIEHGLDPDNPNDAFEDSDNDGLTNLEEYRYGTDPNKADTDGDGFSDSEEIDARTDPLDPNDYPVTGVKTQDKDGDGMPDAWENKYECVDKNTKDNTKDADNDGLINIKEYNYGTNPCEPDSDGDGYIDKVEVDAGTDPLDKDDYPKSKLPWILGIVAGVLVAGGGIGYFSYYEYEKMQKKKKIPLAKVKPLQVARPIVRIEKSKAESEMMRKKMEERKKKRSLLFEAFGKKKLDKRTKEEIKKIKVKEDVKTKPRESIFDKLPGEKDIFKNLPKTKTEDVFKKLSKMDKEDIFDKLEGGKEDVFKNLSKGGKDVFKNLPKVKKERHTKRKKNVKKK